MAGNKRDYYEVLGVLEDVDEDALKKAYKKLVKRYHPNANPGDKAAEAKFREAPEAYSVLSDPQKRQQYNQLGHAALEQGGADAGGFGGGFGGLDFSGDMGDTFGDTFGDIFGGGRSGRVRSGPSRGANTKTSVRITLEEAVFGCNKEIETNFKETCANCHGTGIKAGTSPQTCSKCNGKGKIMHTQQSFSGTVQSVQTCPDCNGIGQVIKEKYPDCYGAGCKTVRKEFGVSIPAGIDNGQCVRLAGGGEPGTGGGERGDLLVKAVVPQRPTFRRQDTSTYSTVPISFTRATLGGSIRIKIVDGEVEYGVRPGTQTDTKVRLKDKGIPSLCSRSVRGDHYATLVVQVPERMNRAQKKVLGRSDDAMNGVTSQEEEKPEKKGIFKQIGNNMSPDGQRTESVRAFLRLFPVVQQARKVMAGTEW